MQQSNHASDPVVVVSSSPGRMRIKVPGLYQSNDEKVRLEEALNGRVGILAVYASPLTGKVLILFDASIAASAILTAAGLFAKTLEQEAAPVDNVEHGRPDRPNALRHNRRTDIGSPSNRKSYPDWHLRAVEEALVQHRTSLETGLSEADVQERLKQGMNILPRKKERSSTEMLLAQLASLPTYMLGVSAILSVFTGGIAEAVAIIAVIALNTGIGFVTERRAERTIASLSELIDDVVPVVRERNVSSVTSSHIVPGDILFLAPGIRIAGDARIVQASGLHVDESALTGESHFVVKRERALDYPAALGDRNNMAYMGTTVVSGKGLAVVVGTGINTEIGAIQSLMNETDAPQTPLQTQLDQLGRHCVLISLGICAAVFVLGMTRGRGLLPMLKAAVSLAVAALPEGLPTVATTSLARGVRLMREKGVLIRRLHAVETLGEIHTICLDKTGTLTLNHMSAVALATASNGYECPEPGMQCERAANFPEDRALDLLLTACVLSNESSIDNGKIGESAHSPNHAGINGSATENALIQLAIDSGLPVECIRERNPVVQSELRAEGRNYMTTVHRDCESGKYIVAVKGSPEEVLSLCASCQVAWKVIGLDEGLRQKILRQNQEMAERQLRVLGFAYCDSGANPPSGQMELVWLGLVGLADPLRPAAKPMIAALHHAGIRTAMITGDQSATALAIAKSLGIGAVEQLRVAETDELEAGGKLECLPKTDVFARVSPARKLQIVQALQRCGEVVAMTGDGINDGPALRAADVGIAMGLRGTDVARSAADVVLKDDQLETVLEAIRQGRTTSENIRKSVRFLLSSNLSEILVVLGSTAIGSQEVLSPVQLLWINLLSDVLPAVALAAEPPEEDIMRGQARKAGRPLIADDDLRRYALEGGAIACGSFAAHIYGILRHGAGQRAATLTFNSLVLAQLLHALVCRSDRHQAFFAADRPSNNFLRLSVGGSIALQLLVNGIPGLRRILGIARLDWMDWATVLGAAVVPLAINEAGKARGRKND